MSKSPKFMVFSLRELIYTLIFIILGVVLLISLIIMFTSKDNNESETPSGKYEAGVYTSSITINGNPMDLTVTLDTNHINSITIDNMSEAITTMYPLVQPAFEDIANQIVTNQTLDNIQFDDGSQYTYTILYNAIADTINRATN